MTASISDLSGNNTSKQVQFFVSVAATQNPVANLQASTTSGSGPLTVAFDGTGSTDDQRLFRWEWYFGDGTTAIGRQVSKTFTSPGTYQVKLLVRDNDGGVNTDTVQIDVTGTVVYGDLTQDGSFGVDDLNALIDLILGRTSPPVLGSAAFIAADVDGDNALGMGDLNLYVDHILGRIILFPVEP